MDEGLVRIDPDLERDHFWWRVRRDLVRGLIERRTSVAGRRILDIGCGSGHTIAMLSDMGAQITGLEIDDGFRGAVPSVQPHIIFGDFLTTEFAGTFDVILMLDVLEHIDDDQAALRKVRGLLGPGGILILSVPAYGFLWSDHDEANRHFRRYTARTMRTLFEQAGLEADQLGYMLAGLAVPKIAVKGPERLGFALSERAVTLDHASLLSKLAYRWFSAEERAALRLKRMLPFRTSVVAVGHVATSAD